MKLSNFVSKEPRALPVFILADTSGSMMGAKINELNLALRHMISEFQNVDEIRGKFQLSIITFGPNVQVSQPLADVEGVQLTELSAGGRTPMGAAFETVSAMIEDKSVVSSRSYTPTIVLVSDGVPTDCPEEYHSIGDYSEWAALNKLKNGERSRKCQRLALAIGDDADVNMLREFIGNADTPLIKAHNVQGISKFFKWVTMSTIARMSSVNPDIIQPTNVVFDIEDEDIII